jgi:hypothetical protein
MVMIAARHLAYGDTLPNGAAVRRVEPRHSRRGRERTHVFVDYTHGMTSLPFHPEDDAVFFELSHETFRVYPRDFLIDVTIVASDRQRGNIVPQSVSPPEDFSF